MINAKNIIRILKRSDFFRNTSILISGTTIAQIIPILLQPILRRLYEPETFGVYAVYTSLVGIFYVISSFRYEMAIIHPHKDRSAMNLLVLSQIINVTFNLIFFVLIYSFKGWIIIFLNVPEKYILFIYLVPVATLLYNFYQSHNYFLIRKKAFGVVSINKFARRGSEGITQVGLKYLLQQNGLVIGDIIGHTVNCISGFFQAKRKGFSLSKVSFVKMKYLGKKYIEYPKYNMASSFLNVFSIMIPVLLINKFFSSEYAGYYDLSRLVLSIPLALIAGSIANVLLQRFSDKKKNNESIKKEFNIVLMIVLIIALLEIVVISAFGTQLFSLFFGEKWGISGSISRILVWSYSITFVVFSFSSVFIALDRIKILSFWQICHFLLIISLILFRNTDFNNFLRLFVLIEIVSFVFMFFILVFIVRKYDNKLNSNR